VVLLLRALSAGLCPHIGLEYILLISNFLNLDQLNRYYRPAFQMQASKSATNRGVHLEDAQRVYKARVLAPGD